MEFAYYGNGVVLCLREFVKDGRDAGDEEKLDGSNKEKKTPGDCIKHIPKSCGSQSPKSSMVMGSPGHRQWRGLRVCGGVSRGQVTLRGYALLLLFLSAASDGPHSG